jgi:hypothetical protein
MTRKVFLRKENIKKKEATVVVNRVILKENI